MRILQHGFRVYTETENFESLIHFYGIKCERRVKIPETSTEAAKIGNFLILSGDKEHIDAVRYVDAIFYLDSLDEFATWLTENAPKLSIRRASSPPAEISPLGTPTVL